LCIFENLCLNLNTKKSVKCVAEWKLSIDFVVLPVYLVFKSRGSRTHSVMHKNALFFSIQFFLSLCDQHSLTSCCINRRWNKIDWFIFLNVQTKYILKRNSTAATQLLFLLFVFLFFKCTSPMNVIWNDSTCFKLKIYLVLSICICRFVFAAICVELWPFSNLLPIPTASELIIFIHLFILCFTLNETTKLNWSHYKFMVIRCIPLYKPVSQFAITCLYACCSLSAPCTQWSS